MAAKDIDQSTTSSWLRQGQHCNLLRDSVTYLLRTARDSKPLEVLGTYDPIPKLPVGSEPDARKQKDIKLDVSRAKYWLGVGAQPTDTAWRILSMVGRSDLSGDGANGHRLVCSSHDICQADHKTRMRSKQYDSTRMSPTFHRHHQKTEIT